MTAEKLTEVLHKEIPLSLSLGAEILELSRESLKLYLPLLPNRNHKGTLFGGSLYSACALASYGLFLAGLEEEKFSTKDIVIADGNIRYLKPVTKDAEVHSYWGSLGEKEEFFNQLRAKGKARVFMRAQIFCAHQLCCEFTARFVCFSPSIEK